MNDTAVGDSSSSAKCCVSLSDASTTKQNKGVFVIEPLESDVLFGRGKKALEHPGNRRMRQIVDSHTINYHSQLKAGKKKISHHVYGEVMKGGTRFLKKIEQPYGWIVVDKLTAMNKICHALRCRKNAHRLIAKSEDLAKRLHLKKKFPQSPSRFIPEARAPNVEIASTSTASSGHQANLPMHTGGLSSSVGVDQTVAAALQVLTPIQSSDLERNLALRYGLGIVPHPLRRIIATNTQQQQQQQQQQQSNLHELLLRCDVQSIAASQHAPGTALNFPF